MSARSRCAASVTEAQAKALLEDLHGDSELDLVGYGQRAVALQVRGIGSPHAIHLDATFVGGRFVLEFHMRSDVACRVLARLLNCAARRQIALHFDAEPPRTM